MLAEFFAAASWAELRECLRTGGSDWNAERVIKAVWQLDACQDVSSLMQSCRTAEPSDHSVNQDAIQRVKG